MGNLRELDEVRGFTKSLWSLSLLILSKPVVPNKDFGIFKEYIMNISRLVRT
jgi:hypothetical protein